MATLVSSIPFFTITAHQNPSLSSCGLLLFNKLKSQSNKHNFKSCHLRRLTVMSAKGEKDGNGEDPSVPSWARPDSDEAPPWARQEAQKESSSLEVPFFVYLLSSAITAIAAIGSIFEYVNQKPVFGVLDPDSVFYAPLLGFFVFTGIPSSAYLWFKSVQVANKEAEDQDRRDGYL